MFFCHHPDVDDDDDGGDEEEWEEGAEDILDRGMILISKINFSLLLF